MDVSKLSDDQRRTRMNIRNFLMVADRDQLDQELLISRERGDKFRAECVQELINEDVASIDAAIHGERWEATGN